MCGLCRERRKSVIGWKMVVWKHELNARRACWFCEDCAKLPIWKIKLLLGFAGFLWCKERPHMLRNGWIRSEGWNGLQLVKMHRWYIFQHQIGHRLNREKVKKKKGIDTIIGCHITYFANPTGSIAWHPKRHPKRPLPKRLRPLPHEDDCKRKR